MQKGSFLHFGYLSVYKYPYGMQVMIDDISCLIIAYLSVYMYMSINVFLLMLLTF